MAVGVHRDRDGGVPEARRSLRGVNCPAAGTVRLTEPVRVKASLEEATLVTYEFTCKKCGNEFEVSCHMDEREAKAVCPKCGGRKATQKLSAAFSSPRPSKY